MRLSTSAIVCAAMVPQKRLRRCMEIDRISFALDKADGRKAAVGRFHRHMDRLVLVFGSDRQHDTQVGGAVIEFIDRDHEG